VDAVLSLYRDKGLAGLSFEQVARHASVGKAALYSRWDRVEELLIVGLRTLAPPPVVDDTGSLRDDLRLYVLILYESYAGAYGPVILRILLDASVDSEMRPYYEEFVTAYVRAARAIVARGVERGQVAPEVDASLLLEELVGATMLHVLFFAGQVPSLPAASRYADRLVDSVLAGAASTARQVPRPAAGAAS
jgi:AcrR family transcriptional regulator